MGMLDFLNKVKAENINLKDLVREENTVSNDSSFEISLGKDAECKISPSAQTRFPAWRT